MEDPAPTTVTGRNLLCRLCMSAREEMVELFSGGLVDKILYCTGLQIIEDDDLPKHICTLCFHFLNIANKFKTSCLLVDQVLNLIYKSKEEKKPPSEDKFYTISVKYFDPKNNLSLLSKKDAKFSNKVIDLNVNNDSIRIINLTSDCTSDGVIDDNCNSNNIYDNSSCNKNYIVANNGDPLCTNDSIISNNCDLICTNDNSICDNDNRVASNGDPIGNNDIMFIDSVDLICTNEILIYDNDNTITYNGDQLCNNDNINSDNGHLICNNDNINGGPICQDDNSICYNDNKMDDSIYSTVDTDVWSNSPITYESDFEWPVLPVKPLEVIRKNHNDHEYCLPDVKKQGLTITEDSEHRNPLSDEKYPHICEICGKMYGTRQYYVGHYRGMHQPRRFKCDLCDYAAIRMAYLKQHKRVHTGAKPYLCEHCPTSFSFKGALNYHVLSKHEKKHDFKCTMCEKAFCALSTLKQHMKEHSNNAPYQCQYCSVWITRRNGWRRHMKSRHGVIIPLQRRGRKRDNIQIKCQNDT